MKTLGRGLAVALLCHGVTAGPPSLLSERTPTVRRKLHGRFLHITDIHPDEFYKVHSSTDEDGACHRGKGPAGPYGAETTDCDSPFSLVNATFDWIAANLKDTIDFVIWTGDSARHDRDEDLPRSADQVLGTNSWIADKFAQLLADDEGTGMTIPVVPNFGNNDILPHNILLPGPNKWFQTYLHVWRRFIPEEQRHSFEFGGWFYVEVIPNKLAVFSLNTLYFFDRNAGVDGCASPGEPGYKQMEWLRVQLQFLRERGMKAILIGHVPPARTESKKLWDETCWQKYTLWMRQFRDIVVVGLYGHMNIDHFLIHDSDEVDIAALSGSSQQSIRQAMDDDLSVQGASDYLMELRQHWAKLPPPPALKSKADGVNEDGKRRKGKKHRDPWGERYHLALVSPSIVPNYFPTLRVFEYNITGLEHVPVWKDAQQGGLRATTESDSSEKHLGLRQLAAEGEPQIDLGDVTSAKKKKKKKKKKKPKKKPRPPAHDPNLNVPSPPAEGSPPGPAYSPQPLTLLGYTQYYANLTHINNLTLTEATMQAGDEGEGWWDWLLRWREGKHRGKKPASPHPPQPREFAFEVEYSTFEDKIYRLGDLTVNSLVGLAVRIGERVDNAKSRMTGVVSWEVDEGEGCVEEVGEGDWEERFKEEEAGEEVEDGDSDDEVEVEKRKKGKKGRKGKKRRKQNKTWLHFLKHAFVGTLEEEELRKFD